MENASSKHMTRRSFLATTGLAAGALAASGMAGCSSISTEGEIPQVDMVEDEKTYISTCRGNCGGLCALQAKVREGKIVSTHPMTFPNDQKGTEQGCAKGMSNVLRLYGSHRLLYPAKRVGERGSGEWEQISWDEAFRLIANKFSAAFEEYGPQSVCFQEGAGNKSAYLNSRFQTLNNYAGANYRVMGVGISRFMQKTGATTLGNGYDTAGLYFRNTLLEIPQNALEDLPNAKTIVVWGSNPAEAGFARSAWYWICKAHEQGANLVTIDPLYSSTAAHSDQWIPVRVGTDAALMCAVANYIIENNLVDFECLRTKSVAPLLIDEGGSYIRLSDVGMAPEDGKEDDPVVWDESKNSFVSYRNATMAAVNGARELPDGRKARTVYDATLENISPFTVEFAAEECGVSAEQIESLARMVATDTPTTFYIDWGIEHTYNSWRVYFCSALLAALTGAVGVDGGAYNTSRTLAAKVFKTPVKVDLSCLEVEDAKPCKAITGDYLYEITKTGKWAGEDFPIRALFIEACDPIDNFSGPVDMLKAFNEIDFIVTVDMFMTATAHYSDLVLPAAMPWEAEDFCTNGFYCQKAIDPVGDAKGDFDIFKGIAEAMGYNDLFPLSGEDYLRSILDTPENIESGVGFDEYREHGVILGDYECEPFATPEKNSLGLTRFYLEHMQPRDDWGQEFSLRDRLPFYEPSIESYPGNPDLEKYPLFGFSSHDHFHGQCVWAHNPWLDEFRTLNGEPFCRIHEKAAAARGIKTGDKVRVFNDRGMCVLSAVLTKGIREDSVWMPHGFFWDEYEEGDPQQLTGLYPDPVSSNSNFNDWICQVEKI